MISCSHWGLFDGDGSINKMLADFSRSLEGWEPKFAECYPTSVKLNTIEDYRTIPWDDEQDCIDTI